MPIDVGPRQERGQRDDEAVRDSLVDFVDTAEGLADPLRFMNQICAVYNEGSDPIADPFAAFSAIPAATGVMRDMTGIRFEVPELVAEKCTGCGACTEKCPVRVPDPFNVELGMTKCIAVPFPQAVPSTSRITKG